MAEGGTAELTLEDHSTLKSGTLCAGLEAPEGAHQRHRHGPGWGIGGNYSGGGSITIRGGTITAQGGNFGAGIGASSIGGDSGTIIISENAVVFAKSESADRICSGFGSGGRGNNTFTGPGGVVFADTAGKVYGAPALPGNVTIKDGYALTVPQGTVLTGRRA